MPFTLSFPGTLAPFADKGVKHPELNQRTFIPGYWNACKAARDWGLGIPLSYGVTNFRGSS
jgi:hypothetical protein